MAPSPPDRSVRFMVDPIDHEWIFKHPNEHKALHDLFQIAYYIPAETSRDAFSVTRGFCRALDSMANAMPCLIGLRIRATWGGVGHPTQEEVQGMYYYIKREGYIDPRDLRLPRPDGGRATQS